MCFSVNYFWSSRMQDTLHGTQRCDRIGTLPWILPQRPFSATGSPLPFELPLLFLWKISFSEAGITTIRPSESIMASRTPSSYRDIDWLELWQNEREHKSWRSKRAKDWDEKAAAYAQRAGDSPYVPLLLSRLPLDPDFTVVDVGCGPGTLALPLARMVKKVTAIDYSREMLNIIEARAAAEDIDNIRCVHCGWEDNWQAHDIETADIAIASRSLNIADLPAALKKLNDVARRYVFITDRIAPSPFDPDAFAAVGREFNSGPDYIFTLNFLYSMGICANVEILELDRHTTFKNQAEALAAYAWMFKDLDKDEEHKLQHYLESCLVAASTDKIVIRRRQGLRWALVWWEKPDG